MSPTTQLQLEKKMELIFSIGYKIIYSITVFIICLLLIKLSRSLVKKFFKRQAETGKIRVDERKAQTMNSIVSSIIKYLLYFVAMFSILKELGVDGRALLAVAGAGSVAIGMGAQSIIQDMLDGFFILFEDHFGVGDLVTIQGKTGVVESITLRTTKIRDANGSIHIIPNGSIGIMTNMSMEYINAIVDIDVDYSENMDHVLAVLRDEMEQTTDISDLQERPQVLGIAGLNDSAVTVRIFAKCNIKENWAIERELRLRIKKRLDKENISIPFPQRTIHIVEDSKKE